MGSAALVPFIAITFGVTWGLAGLFLLFPEPLEAAFGEPGLSNPLFLCAVYAPAIAAFALVLRHGGLPGLARFASRLLLWRAHPGWYALLLLGIPALAFAGAAWKGTLGTYRPLAWHELLPALGLAAAAGPVEEFGWRGVALPLLQRRHSPLRAGLILGAIWATWHLPAFLVSGTPQSGWSVLPYVCSIVALSVVMTALFNASRGSLLLAALFHFQLNNPIWPDAQPYDAPLWIAAAGCVVLLGGGALLRRDLAVTEVMRR